jgi:hypothetical protein
MAQKKYGGSSWAPCRFAAGTSSATAECDSTDVSQTSSLIAAVWIWIVEELKRLGLVKAP